MMRRWKERNVKIDFVGVSGPTWRTLEDRHWKGKRTRKRMADGEQTRLHTGRRSVGHMSPFDFIFTPPYDSHTLQTRRLHAVWVKSHGPQSPSWLWTTQASGQVLCLHSTSINVVHMLNKFNIWNCRSCLTQDVRELWSLVLPTPTLASRSFQGWLSKPYLVSR